MKINQSSICKDVFGLSFVFQDSKIPSHNPILNWLDNFKVHDTVVINPVGLSLSRHTTEIIALREVTCSLLKTSQGCSFRGREGKTKITKPHPLYFSFLITFLQIFHPVLHSSPKKEHYILTPHSVCSMSHAGRNHFSKNSFS